MSGKIEIGAVVQIARNNRALDCCAGKRGRVAWGRKNEWVLVTDHACSVKREDAELTVISVEQQAIEYFEIEGKQRYALYVDMLKKGKATLEDVQEHASAGDPTCRHFLVLYCKGIEKL